MAEKGQEQERQRKLASLEDELLDSGNDVEVGEADLKEAEKQLDEEPMEVEVERSSKRKCIKCNAEFLIDFGAVCEINNKHAFCMI